MRSIPAVLLAFCLGGSVVALSSAPVRASERAVDYSDMRCAFAIKRHAHVDSQIVTWAKGYLNGYAVAMMRSDFTGSIGADGPSAVLSDDAFLRDQLRAFCLRHPSQPIAGALVQILNEIGMPGAKSSIPERHAEPLPVSVKGGLLR